MVISLKTEASLISRKLPSAITLMCNFRSGIRYILSYTVKKHKTVILLIFITLAGFILRIYRLGAPSLWYDELATAGRIEGSFIQTVKGLFVSPFPPLYYMLMNIWVKVFGTSEFSLRFPSLVFSVLSIILVFKLSRELFNTNVGLISALLLSISPYSINYAQDAKMYAMLWCLGLLSFVFLIQVIKNNDYRSLLSYVITMTMSIYTLYIGFLFIIIHNVIFFVFTRGLKQYKRWFMGQLIMASLYLPWIAKFWHNAVNRSGIRLMKPIINYFVHSKETFFLITGISIGDMHLQWLELSVYGILLLSAFIILRKEGLRLDVTKNDFIIVAWIAIPIIIYLLINLCLFPLSSIRYIGFAHLPLIILFSKGLDKYRKAIKSTILIFLLMIILTNHLYPYYAFSLKISRENWRALFERLNQRAQSGDLIIASLLRRHSYYNKNNHDIKWGVDVQYPLNEKYLDKEHDSIFIVYRKLDQRNIAAPEGYRLVEHYIEVTKTGNIGFLWFKKNEDN